MRKIGKQVNNNELPFPTEKLMYRKYYESIITRRIGV